MILIAGRSNPSLAQALADHLHHPLTPTTTTHFSHPETCFHLDSSVRGHDVFILQSGYNPTELSTTTTTTPSDYLIELGMMIQACRMASATKIILLLPSLPYSQDPQDIGDKNPLPCSNDNYHCWLARPGKLVANLLTSAGATQIITLDLHHPQFAGYFDCPLDNLPAWPLALQVLSQHRCPADNWTVLSPDVGGSGRAVEVANRAQLPVALLTECGLIGTIPAHASIFLVDDMLDTGRKLCRALEHVRSCDCRFVLVFVTHALMSEGCLDRLLSQIARNEQSGQRVKIVATDSVASEDALITRISIAPLLAETVQRIQRGESITNAFTQALD